MSSVGVTKRRRTDMKYGIYFTCNCPNCKREIQVTFDENTGRSGDNENMGTKKMLYKKEQPYREKEVFQDLRRND